MGSSTTARIDPNIRVIDGSGNTPIPGLVGMHEHLFFVSPGNRDTTFVEQPVSFAPLYLASGVTTARTAGSIEPYGDLRIKKRIDSGELPSPDLLLTGPYLESEPGILRQIYTLRDENDVRNFVRCWHPLGFSSMKAYMNIKPDQLRVAIEEAHSLHMKVTGHLCSVGFREQLRWASTIWNNAPFGAPDGELYPDRQPGVCGPNFDKEFHEIASKADPEEAELKKTVNTLIQHKGAITSTLAPFEMGTRPAMESSMVHRILPRLLSPEAWSAHLELRAWQAGDEAFNHAVLTKERRFERAFVKAVGIF